MRRFLLAAGAVAGFFTLSLTAAILTVNLGSRGEEVVVPDLAGQELVPAIEALERIGLTLKIRGKEYHDTIPAGTVISHQPPAGGSIRMGRSVEALVSVGPRRITVPELRGDFLLQAQSVILENRLGVGRVARVSSPIYPKETVMGQHPFPGDQVDKGSGVDLLVSTGPSSVLQVMPDFIGRTLSETLAAIQEVGLDVDAVSYRDYPGVPPGTVIGQKPMLGSPVGLTDSVELVVTRAKSAPERGGVRYAMLSFHVPEGLRARRVRVVVEGERGTREVLNEDRPPGSRVQLLVEVEGSAKARIYADDQLIETRSF
jgi:serine/threonine-protein kinase